MIAPSSKPHLLAALGWLTENGADEAICEAAVNRFAAVEDKPVVPPGTPTARSVPDSEITSFRSAQSREPAPSRRAPPQISPGREPVAKAATPSDTIGRAIEVASACNSLGELREALEAFEGCPLKKSATKTVFADGTPQTGIMLIGEAPGRDEDLVGLPFVGRAGKLLDKMFAAIGLDRKTNIYITNVINWRPPENREPSPDEAATCLPFLRRHIELASPEIIVLLGAVAARHVMGRSDGIMRLRGKWLEYYVNGRMVPVMPTLHPAYLLRRAIDKRLAWKDLQEISAKVNLLGLLEQFAAHG